MGNNIGDASVSLTNICGQKKFQLGFSGKKTLLTGLALESNVKVLSGIVVPEFGQIPSNDNIAYNKVEFAYLQIVNVFKFDHKFEVIPFSRFKFWQLQLGQQQPMVIFQVNTNYLFVSKVICEVEFIKTFSQFWNQKVQDSRDERQQLA